MGISHIQRGGGVTKSGVSFLPLLSPLLWIEGSEGGLFTDRVVKLSSVLAESRNVWDGDAGHRENQVPLLD